MKTLLYIALLSSAFLFSCRKDEFPSPEIETSTDPAKLQADQYDRNFLFTAWQMIGQNNSGGYKGTEVTITDYCTINYRLRQGFQIGHKYFYKIEKKWQWVFSEYWFEWDQWGENYSDSSNWYTMSHLYRYDPNTKTALLYDDENDLDPQIIMDFNLNVGDTYYLDEEHDLRFVVVSKTDIDSDDIEYPVLCGYIESSNDYAQLYHYSSELFYFSPFNPNPLFLGDYYGHIDQGSIYKDDPEKADVDYDDFMLFKSYLRVESNNTFFSDIPNNLMIFSGQ